MLDGERRDRRLRTRHVSARMTGNFGYGEMAEMRDAAASSVRVNATT
jgi:hypothetical protein